MPLPYITPSTVTVGLIFRLLFAEYWRRCRHARREALIAAEGGTTGTAD